ncbi:hypothetical protein J3R83DRAFT_4649 [Lanmaoa asiatica]|nr:hypothetical protein J3R83DRAFT_4649 [Lanmaoa asiatica]
MASTPAYSDSLEWITAYLTIHSLSVPSRRYSFILWVAVVFIFLVFAVLHWTGSAAGLLGSVWSKWSLRRRTWRKKHTLALAQRTNHLHRQPIPLPSNAQLLSLAVLTLASLALAFVGPDYLAPSFKVWQIQARSSELYDTSTFVPYMPQYTISKSLWSSSARAGQIAFALIPLCVLFALKAPPFAIFAIPFMIQLYFDKLAWLHRWAGRLIWFLVLIHVALWSIQLAKDVNPSTGRVAYVYAWSYTPFIYGWIAFALLTLIILLSLHPIRRQFYDQFYILHVLLVPFMLVTAGLHHPSVSWWCWAALSLWVGERLWRGTWWIFTNGILGRVALGSSPAPSNFKNSPSDTWEMDDVYHPSVESTLPHSPIDGRSPSPLELYYLHDKSPISSDCDTPVLKAQPPLPHSAEQTLFRTSPSQPPSPYIPPSGYVHAELLSGRTVRLRLITPGFLPWSPGQHFLLNIPSVSRFTSHPFTCASVCDEEAPTDAGRMMLFLVRTKSGWTQDLWNLVSRLTADQSVGDASPAFPSDSPPKNGVLLRAYVDGPFGSAKRVRWGNYSTGVIITGGSGVSFGLSLLQYMCMCLAGRDGRHLGGRPGGWGWKGANLKRVRFIWLVREYSHVQWCASIIRRCMSIVPPSALQVDIYVTNFRPIHLRHPAPLAPPRARFDRELDEELQPPHPNFIRESSAHLRSRSTESVESHESCESDVDLSYYLGEQIADEPPADEMRIAHETNMLDLTNFDGDVDLALPGEAYLSHRLKKEGKLRRLRSRKLSATERMNQDAARVSHPLAYGEGRTPRHVQDSRQAYPDQYMTPSRSSRVPRPRKIMTLSTQSTDRLLAASPLSERPNSASSDTDLYSPPSHHPESPLSPYSPSNSVRMSSDLHSTVSLVTTHGGPRSPIYPAKGYHDVKSEPEKSQAVQTPPSTTNMHLHGSHSAPLPTSTLGASSSQVPFEMDEQEATDVNVVSEHARLGKPKLDKVIADEVQASKGAIVVACCGPTSLNVMVRKIVAAQIDPWRIRRGDMRGSIKLVSEEFEY